MKKFTTSFLLIFSLFVLSLNLQANVVSKSEDNASTDVNKTEAKQEIVNIIQDNINSKSEKPDPKLVEFVAQKVVDGNTSSDHGSTKKSIFLTDLIDKIRDINTQLGILKIQKGDSNQTSIEITTLVENKRALFRQLPAAIANQNLDKDSLVEYIEKKNLLNKTLKRYKYNQKSKEYIKSAIELQTMEVSEIFYATLIQIEKMFVDGTSQSRLKDMLQKALIEIQINEYQKIENLKNSLSESNKELFAEDLSLLQNDKETYEEILNYFSKNTDLLASNIFFTRLNLKAVIDAINNNMPFNTSYVNSGKIILIFMIMVLFYSLRRLIAKTIYFLFTIFYRGSEANELIKTQVIDIIKKPLGVLLIAYGTDICISIFFYPTPVPIRFGNVFSMIYIILYAWLVIEILDGFGIMILSNIAKKSGRKEIINLIIKIIFIIIIIIAVLMILRQAGFDVSALLASLGIGGLALALATKDIIANFLASIMLLFDNSFSQGDWIVAGDVEGTVVETGLRKTIIRTFDNALVFVPNSKIMESNIKNWNRRKIGRQIKMDVGLSYDSTAEQIQNCVNDIKDMLVHHEGIAKPDDNALKKGSNIRLKYKQNMVSVDDLAGYKNAMYVYLNEFSASSIDIHIECFTKAVTKAAFVEVKQDVMIKIMEIVNKYEASFAFPSQSLYIEKLPKIVYDNGQNNQNDKA